MNVSAKIFNFGAGPSLYPPVRVGLAFDVSKCFLLAFCFARFSDSSLDLITPFWGVVVSLQRRV